MKKLLYIIGLILFFAANTTAANTDFLGARVEVVAKRGGRANLLSKLDNFPNLKNMVSRLDEVADAGLISRIDNLATTNPSKLTKLNELNFSLPADRPIINGQRVSGDFTVTKTIEGKSVSVYYDRPGFADFKPFSPGDDYKIVSQTLTGTATDMRTANNAMKQKFAGQPNKFRWNGNTTWFEIKDANGNWVQCTWHHYQDGRTLFPVPTKIHSAIDGGFNHTGGGAIIDGGLQDIFY